MAVAIVPERLFAMAETWMLWLSLFASIALLVIGADRAVTFTV